MRKPIPDKMKQYLEEMVRCQATRRKYESVLAKLSLFMSSNYIRDLTVEEIYDFRKWLRLRGFTPNVVKSYTNIAMRYCVWLNCDNQGVMPNITLYLTCECGRGKVLIGDSWKCPFCDSEKKKGRPSKAKPGYVQPSTAFVVENEQCKTCQYRTDDSFIRRNINCDYLLITGRAKTKNKDYKLPPHCTYYKRGDRIIPRCEREDEDN